MGCGSSTPDVILDDPGEMEPIKGSIKSKMMGMSEDYNAVNEAGQPWFFINKTGSFFGSGNCIVELENFKTGSNPEKPKKGEVLWTAKFNQTPRFDQMIKPKTGAYKRYAPAFQSLLAGDFQAAFRAAGSSGMDQEDSAYFQRMGRSFNDGGPYRVIKWQLNTSAQIVPGTRGRAYGEHRLDVWSSGTAICDYDYKDGRYHKNEAEFVDTLSFNLVQCSTNQSIAAWYVPMDMTSRYGSTSANDVFQDTAVFTVSQKGGWFATPEVATKPNFDPTFALVVAYLCSKEYSPKAIMQDLKPAFPSRP